MINKDIIGAPCKHGRIPFSCDRCTIEHLQEEIATARQESTAYRISLENVEASLPKIKSDAVLVFCDWLLSEINWDVSHYGKKYANKLEGGE